MSPVIPSSLGVFVLFIPFIAFRIFIVVNGMSSSVVINSMINALSNFWLSLSDSSLSSGVKDYIM